MIMAIDPGGSTREPTTAIIVADNVNFSARTFSIHATRLISFNDRADIYSVLWQWEDQLTAIIIEDFMLDPKKAASQSWSRFEPVKVIERVTVYCEELNIAHMIVMQAPILRLSADKDGSGFRAALPGNHNKHLKAAYKHLRYYVHVNHNRQNTTNI